MAEGTHTEDAALSPMTHNATGQSSDDRAAEVSTPACRRYLALFIAVSFIVGLSYRVINRGIDALVCYHDRPADKFLAFCAAPSFGDFEHGAYYYDLVPAAVTHLRAADVLFLGSSRAQFALSTNSVRRYFADRGIRPYLLGFGYNEGGGFALSIILKHRLKPKAIVVLADPFFRNQTSGEISFKSMVVVACNTGTLRLSTEACLHQNASADLPSIAHVV